MHMEKYLVLATFIGSVIALLFALFTGKKVLRFEEGTPLMSKISRSIREGANAYLRRQYTVVGIFFACMIVVLCIMAACHLLTWFVPFAFLTGGFFGDFLPQLVGIIDPDTTFKALPSLFTPLDDTITILIGAMALGFVQIVTGMAISFVEKIKKGQIMDAIWEELTWWVVFAGIACMALGVTNIVLYVGLAMVVVGSGWSAKGFGKVTAIFGSVYNHVTGYFGDILSYSRLMTLMLAGSVIASVFNTLGAIPGNVVFFLLVSVAGNGLNFALNLLSCYVHDLRLQCLEYFGKFYQDGGKPFEPLAINTKYVDIQS